MNEPIIERIEKRLEKIDDKIDIIMTNCIPTLQGKVENLAGSYSVLTKIIVGIAIGTILAIIGIMFRILTD